MLTEILQRSGIGRNVAAPGDLTEQVSYPWLSTTETTLPAISFSSDRLSFVVNS